MRDINAAELKKKYVDKEVALTAIKRAGREDVHIVESHRGANDGPCNCNRGISESAERKC